MERITSKLIRVLVVTLLSAATMATAASLTLKASSGVLPQDPIPPKPMCEAWASAKAQNSPTAPSLAPQCHAEWAARGLAIEPRYRWAAELRAQLPNDSARRGFDIGMAAAEGQTAHGPGKQALHDTLKPAEQVGYSIAVNQSLMWNKEQQRIRHDELEAKGKALTAADQSASVLLNKQPEGPARRGFYIGMAAAEGHTLPGPGKQATRATLSPEEQGGFDTAVSYSLMQNNIMGSQKPAEPPSSDPAEESRDKETEPPVRVGSDNRNLKETLDHLRRGRELLEAAKPDEGGHLEKAIDNINKAIQALQKALAGTK